MRLVFPGSLSHRVRSLVISGRRRESNPLSVSRFGYQPLYRLAAMCDRAAGIYRQILVALILFGGSPGRPPGTKYRRSWSPPDPLPMILVLASGIREVRRLRYRSPSYLASGFRDAWVGALSPDQYFRILRSRDIRCGPSCFVLRPISSPERGVSIPDTRNLPRFFTDPRSEALSGDRVAGRPIRRTAWVSGGTQRSSVYGQS